MAKLFARKAWLEEKLGADTPVEALDLSQPT
jgi:hypothetical protein